MVLLVAVEPPRWRERQLSAKAPQGLALSFAVKEGFALLFVCRVCVVVRGLVVYAVLALLACSVNGLINYFTFFIFRCVFSVCVLAD